MKIKGKLICDIYQKLQNKGRGDIQKYYKEETLQNGIPKDLKQEFQKLLTYRQILETLD